MIKRALFIGIDDYAVKPLPGSVIDAKRMYHLFSQHENGHPNFASDLLIPHNGIPVTFAKMQQKIEDLLLEEADAALLYFSGHGSKNLYGGFLVSQDATQTTPGMSFKSILRLVRKSPIKEITVIIDCCYSGEFGNTGTGNSKIVKLREGVSILTASTSNQLAWGNSQGGIFTSILASGLEGLAADLRGVVTAASLYYMADSLLTAWEQRPMCKLHLSKMLPLRRVRPKISSKKLRKLREFFPLMDFEYRLSPKNEPDKKSLPEEHQEVDKKQEAIFAVLQEMRAQGLVEPVEPHIHLYFAAKEFGRCRLTQLGKFYWWLIEKRKA